MKFRSFISALAIVVLVLLLIAVGGFFWLTAQNPLRLLKGGQDTTPGAAIFVPKQAPAMVSLLVNPDQLESFRLVAARPAERRQARAELEQLKQNLFAATRLDYKRDIQPWLGNELTLAVTTLDIDRDPANGQQPGYLLALSTKDTQQSREFLQLFWQKRAVAGSDLIFEQYKGVKLIYASPSPQVAIPPIAAGGYYKTQPERRRPINQTITPPLNASLVSASVGDRFVLFANHPKVLRDAINNVQAPDLNLSSANFYTQSLEALVRPRVGLTFLNLPKLTDLVAEAVSPKQVSNAIDASTSSATFQTLAIGLGLNRQGLLAETALVATGESSDSSPALSQPVGALKYVPGTSPIAASGVDLNQLWAQVSGGISESETPLISQPLAVLQSLWQIDLPQDVFSWVKDEYALAVVPTSQASDDMGSKTDKKSKKSSKSGNRSRNPLANSQFSQNDWIFAVERSTPEAEQAIAHLDEIAKQQGLSVGVLKLDEQSVSAWTELTTASNTKRPPQNLEAKVRGLHTTVGKYEIFTTSIAAMDAALKAPDNSLLIGDLFKQAIAPLDEPNNGYLYLDWATSQPLLERQFPLFKVIELAGKPIFAHLRSLTVSSYGREAGVQRGEVFVRLDS